MNRRMYMVGLVTVVMFAMGLNPTRADEQAVPKCPVMGGPANLSVSTATDDGPVFFCCKGCIKKFEGDPAKYVKAVAEQRKALADRPKVQVTCPISGNPVDPKVFTEHDGKKVYFCCKDCIAKFKQEPEKYKTALANAYTYQTKCPVMGGAINPKAFTTLPTGEKIYYCCPACDKKFRSDPGKYAPKLAEQGIKINVDKIKETKEAEEHEHGGA